MIIAKAKPALIRETVANKFNIKIQPKQIYNLKNNLEGIEFPSKKIIFSIRATNSKDDFNNNSVKKLVWSYFFFATTCIQIIKNILNIKMEFF